MNISFLLFEFKFPITIFGTNSYATQQENHSYFVLTISQLKSELATKKKNCIYRSFFLVCGAEFE